MLANPATIDSSQFDNFIASRTEPNWMTEQRLQAWKAFEQAEQPFWRRTNLKGFNLNDYHVADADVTIDFAGADGVTVLPLAEALRFHGDAVQKVFGSAVRTDRDKYSALNNAYVNAGVFVHVAKNIECDAPIHITYRVKNAGDLVAPRTLIYAEPNSAIRVIEEIVSDEFTGKALILSGTEIEAHDNANVHYTSIQTLHENVTMFGNQQMNLVGKDAHGDWLNIVLGGAVQHVTLEANMSGNGSSVTWNGLLYANGEQNLLVAPTLHHAGLNTEGQIHFKTVVDDQGYAVFDGMVKIPATGQGTNSDLREHALHLSNQARSDSIPGLEIDANEVKAGHGSTSSQIDAEQLFYLQSRGLPFEEAKRTIVIGFVGEIIDMIDDETIRERVEEIVAEKV